MIFRFTQHTPHRYFSSSPLIKEKKWTPHEYKEKIRKADRVLRTFTRNARIMVVNNTHITSSAMEKHSLSPIATKILGRAMAGASLLASSLKGEERVCLQWDASGPMKKKTVVAEASRSGEVRGYVSNPKLYQSDSLPIGYAMSTGILKVSNILYNMAKPYTSTVQMAGADVVSDLSQYFQLVEQIPTYLDLETKLDGITGKVIFSGGLLIQPLPMPNPKDSKQVIDEYKVHLKKLRNFWVDFDYFLPSSRQSHISHLLLEEGKSLREVLDIVSMHPSDIQDDKIEKHVLDFFCRCSRQQFEQIITTMPENSYEELKKVAHEEEAPSVTCIYCGKQYSFGVEDFKVLGNVRKTKQ